jgi:glucose-1-phosphate thymidylyltransferase
MLLKFVRVIETTPGHEIGCIEEVAYRMGYINKVQLFEQAESLAKADTENI